MNSETSLRSPDSSVGKYEQGKAKLKLASDILNMTDSQPPRIRASSYLASVTNSASSDSEPALVEVLQAKPSSRMQTVFAAI